MRRSSSDRVVAGVAGGIATRLDIPAWVVRLAFVVLAFGGGLGIALYIAGWLLIPEDDASEPIARSLMDRIQDGSGWLGVVLVGIGVLIAVSAVDFIRGDLAVAVFLGVIGVMLYRGEIGSGDKPAPSDPPPPAPTPHREDPLSARFADEGAGTTPPVEPPTPTPPVEPPPPAKPKHPPSILGRLTIALALIATGVMAFFDYALDTFDPTPRHYLGLALGIIGVALMVGSILGRARGLIFVGIVLAPFLVLAPLAEFDLDSGIGQRQVVVTDLDQLAASYEMAIGELVVDLRGVDFAGRTVELDTSLGIGSLRVLVPPSVGVDMNAEVGIGEVQGFGSVRSGFARDLDITREGEGTLILDAQTLIGEVRVSGSTGGASAAGGTPFVGGMSEVITSPEQLQAVYEIQSGDLVLDLSNLVLTEPRMVSISNDLGRIEVRVPDRATTTVSAHADLGSVTLFGTEWGGFAVDEGSVATGEELLILDIDIDSGEIVVEEG